MKTEREILQIWEPAIKRHAATAAQETVHFDDLAQVGRMAVIRMARRMPNAGDGQMHMAIRNAIVDELRSQGLDFRAGRTVRHRTEEIETLDASDYQALQVFADPVELIHHRKVTRRLAIALRDLQARDRAIITLYYDREMDMREIGKKLAVDVSTISRAHRRAIITLSANIS